MRNYLNRSDVYFSLNADLEMAEWIARNSPSLGWNPIGTAATQFKGHFLGNGHTISGLTLNRPTSYNGLFGYAGGAEISNLTVTGDIDGTGCDGLLIGRGESCTVTNCHVSGTVKSQAVAGGLAGYLSGTVTGCSARADVTGTTQAGGFAGNLNGTISGCEAAGDVVGTSRAGGFAGYLWNSGIENCRAEGAVTANGSEVGGLIGYVEIRDVEGKFDFTNLSAITAISGSASKIGGVIGALYARREYRYDDITITLTQLKSSIRIDNAGSGDCAGLIGAINYENSRYTPSYCLPNVTLSSSFSLGEVNAPQAAAVGGLVGSALSDTKIEDSYFTGTIVGKSDVGGICGQNGDIRRTYTNANIHGEDNVGGILGDSTKGAGIHSSFAICPNISASQTNAGRIYGNGTVTCGASGTQVTNFSLVDTKISVNGKAIPYTGSSQDGDVYAIETLRDQAIYQGLGWDFADGWKILQTECLPFKASQTAPPIMLSTPAAGSFIVTGKTTDDGTVYIRYMGQTFEAESSNHTWTIRTDPLKAGEKLTVWAVSPDKFRSYDMSYTVSYPGSGTEEDPYQLYTAADLANLSGAGWYKLMNDIDLTDIDWDPVGRTSAVMTVLDGDNHTVKGLRVYQENTNYCGLFSAISGATIKNLTIDDAAVSGGEGCGVIAGSLTGCTLENVSISNSTVNGKADCGGVAGVLSGCTVSGVSVTATEVTATGSAGGICGTASDNTSFTLTVFNGSVEGQGNVGGITGSNNGGSITKCCSQGTVKGTGSDSYGAGIAGYNSGTVADCFTSAEISSTNYVGGIAGINFSSISHCYASGNLSSNTLGAGITAYNDGASASVKGCAVAMEKIESVSPTGNSMRVLGGIRNGASLPATADNIALTNMMVSENGVAVQVYYDDPMHGKGVSSDDLRTKASYTGMGWNFSDTWTVNGSAMPELKGLRASGTSRNDNFMYAEAINTSAGETFDLSLCLSSKDEPSGCQFDIMLPEGMEIDTYYDEDEEEDLPAIFPGARMTNRHSLAYRRQPNGSMRVICIANGTARLTGDDGEVVRIRVKVADNVVNGMYNIRLNAVFQDSKTVAIRLNNVGIPVSVLNDNLSAQGCEVMRGQIGEVTVNMNNKSGITGFQFDVYIPDDIMIAIASDGRPDVSLGSRGKSAHVIASKEQPDGSTRFIVYAADGKTTFTGNEGEIFKIKLDVPEEAALGSHDIVLKNIYLSNSELKSVGCGDILTTMTVTRKRRKGDVNTDGIVTGSDISAAGCIQLGNEDDDWDFWCADINDDSKVTAADIKSITYTALEEVMVSAPRRAPRRAMGDDLGLEIWDDVHIYFQPVAINPGEEALINVNLDHPNNKVSLASWYVTFPAGFSLVEDPDAPDDKFYHLWYEENTARTKGQFMLIMSDYADKPGVYGFTHVNIAAGNYAKKKGTILTFKLKADESVKPGVYTGHVHTFDMLDDVDYEFACNEEWFSIFVGDMGQIEYAPLTGRYEDEMAQTVTSAFAASDRLLSLDLTGVAAMPEGTSFASANPNTVVFVNADTEIGTTIPNKAVDGVAPRLDLIDGHSFGVDREFTAGEATYTRVMTQDEVASIVIPFANEAEIGVEFGIEAEYDPATGIITYTSASHEAHQPVLVKATQGGTKVFKASNVAISPAAPQANSGMFGNYVHGTSDEAVYKVDNGKLATTTALEPFRGYYTGEFVRGITTGVEGIGVEINLNADIYTLSGIRLNCTVNDLAPGVYIIGGHKVLIK